MNKTINNLSVNNNHQILNTIKHKILSVTQLPQEHIKFYFSIKPFTQTNTTFFHFIYNADIFRIAIKSFNKNVGQSDNFIFCYCSLIFKLVSKSFVHGSLI